MPMETRTDRRGYKEHFVSGWHLNLDDLKQEAQHLGNQYLYKENIPNSPKPEFHVTRLKHDTDLRGLKGIETDKGFRVPHGGLKDPHGGSDDSHGGSDDSHGGLNDPHGGSDDPHGGVLLWWSLAVGHEEVKSAETRLLQQKFSNLTEDEASKHPSFLYKFTSSPAFSETSRLGSYRFTFNLEDVLEAYRLQFCSEDQPVMRIYETVLHKQEVQHTVLVHSPANQELFSEYPLLTDDPNAVCVYKDKHFIWRPYAMSETHRYELLEKPERRWMSANMCYREPFYIWDNVAVALHVDQQVLKFDADQLRKNLKFCHPGKPVIGTFDSLEDARKQVKDRWPDDESPLEEESSLEQKFTVPDLRLVLVGRTGSGKSSTGNLILGRDAFSSAAGGKALCCLQKEKVLDWEVTVVDTPGLSQRPKVKRNISACVDLSGPGPHAFLLVIRAGTLMDEQRTAVRRMEEIFGNRVWRFTFIVLIDNNQSEFVLRRTKTELQRILNGLVEDRFYFLNHNGQIWNLLDAVANMVVVSGGQVFSWCGLEDRGSGRKSPSPGLHSPPTTLILGDIIIRNVPFPEAEIRSFPGITVTVVLNKLQDLLPSLPSIQRVIVHVGGSDIVHQQSEETKKNFIKLFDFLKHCGKDVFISGPIPTLNRGSYEFSRIYSLHMWIQQVCKQQRLAFINNFDVFWKRWYWFAPNGVYLNKRGSKKLAANMKRAVWSSGRG